MFILLITILFILSLSLYYSFRVSPRRRKSYGLDLAGSHERVS